MAGRRDRCIGKRISCRESRVDRLSRRLIGDGYNERAWYARQIIVRVSIKQEDCDISLARFSRRSVIREGGRFSGEVEVGPTVSTRMRPEPFSTRVPVLRRFPF